MFKPVVQLQPQIFVGLDQLHIDHHLLVLEVFNCRWFDTHRYPEVLSQVSALLRLSIPHTADRHSIISLFVCDRVILEVHRVKKTGESAVPCGTPVLQTTVSDVPPFRLTHFGLSAR